METKIYNLRTHRLPLSAADFELLRSGAMDSICVPGIVDYCAGDIVLLCDRRNLRVFAMRRLRSAIPDDIQRPDRVRLSFCPGPGILCRCDGGNIYSLYTQRGENHAVFVRPGDCRAVRR